MASGVTLFMNNPLILLAAYYNFKHHDVVIVFLFFNKVVNFVSQEKVWCLEQKVWV